MNKTIGFWAFCAIVLLANQLLAQVATPNPDIRGPVRRAAGAAAEAAGAPGVENRIENREQGRDLLNAQVNPNAAARANARIADADRWRYKYHNNQWWYYTPSKTWMTYRNNAWGAFMPAVPSMTTGRYSSGYRNGNANAEYFSRRDRLERGYNPNAYNPDHGTGVGANLGADIGAAAGGAAGAQRGAALGGAVGQTVDAARNAAKPPLPPPVPVTPSATANPVLTP